MLKLYSFEAISKEEPSFQTWAYRAGGRRGRQPPPPPPPPPRRQQSVSESFSGKFFLATRAQSEKVGPISFRLPNFFLPVRPCFQN
jgi:hypothetical protein